MVSTLDSESSDPSSNLGGTCFLFSLILDEHFSLKETENGADYFAYPPPPPIFT